MRSIPRTVAGLVLMAAAGFGLAYLLLKKGNAAPAAEVAAPREAAPAPAPEKAAAVAAETPPHKHRAKHPRRGSQPVEAAK